MKILSVRPAEDRSGRYILYLDNDQIILVHEDVVVKRKLLPGKELGTAELDMLIREDEQAKVKHVSLRYLSHRPRSENELRHFLQHKGYQREDIDETIRMLTREGFLNDRFLAEQWVKARLKNKNKGRCILKQELHQKGIESEIIEEVMSQISDEEEFDSCLTFAVKKLRQSRNRAPRCIKKRLYASLIRRGFTHETVAQVIKHLIQTNELEEQDGDGGELIIT
jgi:regulatory protein